MTRSLEAGAFSQAHYLDLAIGALIENRRKRKKLTQDTLSKATKISQPRISRIEAGASITFAEYRALEAVLGKKLDEHATAVVSIARKGSGAMTAAGVQIETSELIPLVARRWAK